MVLNFLRKKPTNTDDNNEYAANSYSEDDLVYDDDAIEYYTVEEELLPVVYDELWTPELSIIGTIIVNEPVLSLTYEEPTIIYTAPAFTVVSETFKSESNPQPSKSNNPVKSKPSQHSDVNHPETTELDEIEAEERERNMSMKANPKYEQLLNFIRDKHDYSDFVHMTGERISPKIFVKTREYIKKLYNRFNTNRNRVIDSDEVVMDSYKSFEIVFYKFDDILDIYDISYNDDETDFTLTLNCSESERERKLSTRRPSITHCQSISELFSTIQTLKLRCEYVIYGWKNSQKYPILAA